MFNNPHSEEFEMKDAINLGAKVGAVVLGAGLGLIGVQMVSDVYETTKDGIKDWRDGSAARRKLIADAKALQTQAPATVTVDVKQAA